MRSPDHKVQMDQVLVVVSGKVNLFLRVLESCTSGYHLIETFFHSVDIRDEVLVRKRTSGIHLTVEPGKEQGVPEGKENFAYKAAELFLEAAQPAEGVEILVKKKIPVGAGLGGGSADGAATLRGLNLLFGNPLPEATIYQLAGDLGSDVPFLLYGGASLAWGRGNRLIPLKTLPPIPVGLCYPRFQVSSRWAYEMLDKSGERRYPGTALITYEKLNQEEWIFSHLHNDFEDVLFHHHPELKEIKEAFLGKGAVGSLLAGSGSSVFGIFRDRKGMVSALEEMEKNFPVDVYESGFLPHGMVIEIPM